MNNLYNQLPSTSAQISQSQTLNSILDNSKQLITPNVANEKWQSTNLRKKKRNSPEQMRNIRQKTITDYWLDAPKTSNRFENLPTDDEGIKETSEEEEKIPKPPPIFVYGIENMKPLTEMLEQHAKNSYVMKLISNSQVKINLNEPKLYNDIIKLLQEKKTEFHSYQNKTDRKFKIVLRDLHHSTDLKELEEAINSYGHKVTNIYNIKHNTYKTPLPMFYVELEQKENNKEIYKIDLLMNSKVKIEPPRVTRDIIQCSRCQRHGHTKNFCNRRPRCVKCTGDHPTINCERKEKNNDVKCVNCNGNHPANYKGCAVRKEIIQRKYPTLRPRSHQYTTTIPQRITTFNAQAAQPGRTYAQVTSEQPQHTCNEAQNQAEVPLLQAIAKIEQMISIFMENMNNMTKLITTLIAKMT